MSNGAPQLSDTQSAPPAEPWPGAQSAAPLCLVMDEESSVRKKDRKLVASAA